MDGCIALYMFTAWIHGIPQLWEGVCRSGPPHTRKNLTHTPIWIRILILQYPLRPAEATDPARIHWLPPVPLSQTGSGYRPATSGSLKHQTVLTQRTNGPTSKASGIFFGIDSYMLIGWQSINNKWYLLGKSGDMLTGWQMANDKWYYLNPSGDMLSDTVTPDGYRVDKNGEWVR